MNWKLLRDSLVNQPQHHERPQQIARIDHGLRLVQEGLGELAGLGHPFHLEPGAVASSDPWPRMVFHLTKAPRGWLCHSEFDFDLLGGYEAGWHDTLEEAKHSAGMDKQFTRGGVFPKSGLPSVVDEATAGLTPLERLRKRGLLAADGTRE